MKKHLLFTLAILTLSINVNAQSCSPDPFYMDSVYGAWPDTITNFPAGQEGVFYSQVLDFKLPTDAGDIDPTYSGVPIDSAVLTDVTGLPPGLSYICDNSNCTWMGGDQGCASIFGTPTTPGTYDVVIELDGWVTVIILGAISQPSVFTGYVIEVTPALEIVMYQKNEFSSKQNSPNPFSEETMIHFTTGQSANIDLRVMDILGNIVHKQNVQANAGENSIRFRNDALSDGIYVYTLSNGERSITKKMTVRR
ncbi:MAG: T9SS type A sorting domain-containing protein [Crocinitomicaceae bacterium]|jgi:hypothetical protein|nr:T9SS type A sorting domain-containing protein [Crocinitomicaceae bacterium]